VSISRYDSSIPDLQIIWLAGRRGYGWFSEENKHAFKRLWQGRLEIAGLPSLIARYRIGT